MASHSDHQVTLTRHQTFLALAFQHHAIVKALVAKRNARQVKDDADVDFQCLKNAQIQRSGMVSVVFSALALEAFINNYAAERFSKNYFENHLDRLNPVSKWLVIPRLATGKQVATDGKVYGDLKRLFKLRDKLVHYKTRKKNLSQLSEDDWVTEKHSEEAISAVESAVRELATVDASVDISWLKSAREDPYA
jgi:hypothetical protein